MADNMHCQLYISSSDGKQYRVVCKEVENLLKNKGIRVNLDDREEKVGYKMREAIMSKYPYILVLGDNEVTNKTITYRTSQSEEKVTLSLDEFANKVKEEIENKTR